MANRVREEDRQKALEEGVPTTRLTPQGPANARSSMVRSEATARQSRQTQADRARSRGGRRSRIDWRRSPEESAVKLEFIGDRTTEGRGGAAASGLESGAKRSEFSCSPTFSWQQHAIRSRLLGNWNGDLGILRMWLRLCRSLINLDQFKPSKRLLVSTIEYRGVDC
jgi:hypothetical protein